MVMKKIAILYSKYIPTIDAIISHLNNVQVELSETMPNKDDFDLIINVNNKEQINYNHINVHYSLLPAFRSEEPVRDAILAGVKVTGVTFYYTHPEKIIAQYPIFISNSSHYDDVERELEYIVQTLYPLVIEKILKNEAFEIKNLISKSCVGSCGGCSSCKN